MCSAAACVICFETSPAPKQCGCACRGDAGLAHVACLARAAAMRVGSWETCRTCKQPFTGATLAALARAWCVATSIETDEGQLAAAHMVSVLGRQEDYTGAERASRALRAAIGRKQGDDSEAARIIDITTAKVLLFQGKYAEVERISRASIERARAALGDEHVTTLQMCQLLAQALSFQNKHLEAERITLEVVGGMRRVYGERHAYTLESAICAPWVLWRGGKHAEAEAMQRELLCLRESTLGPDHPGVLSMRTGLATMLAGQNKRDEASAIAASALAVSRRVLGPDHPETTRIAGAANYIDVAFRPVYDGPMAAGTRVTVRWLRSAQQHNGAHGTVLSRATSGRYAVQIDGGARVLLRAECVSLD